MKQKYLSAAAAAVFVAIAFLGCPAEAQTPSLAEKAGQLVTAFEKDTVARVGVSVVDLRSRKALVARRAGELFVPASNQKLLTSAFALVALGGDFEFATTVRADGKDIVIQGDYDPTLGDPRLAKQAGESIYTELDRWAAAVKKEFAGVFSGDI
ncbi:MAG: D-alanyl-D-alanine carboxypeptidase, partial [Phycisphaerae bacterium]|nr:D-alanyl-D-alanine carboxypeptidase [Phycisphaerae bacterium]